MGNNNAAEHAQHQHDQEFLVIERRMLEHSGVPFEEFKTHNVVIDEQGNFVRTIEVGFNRDPTASPKQRLVMMHGYGGSSIMFWKVIQPLSEHYHVILVDILGMGSSSRPAFNIIEAQEATDYLIGWIEVWRQKMDDMTGFILAGHSFGGYVCGHYACKYPQHVKKLLLLSPLGVPKREFTDEQFQVLYDQMEVPPGRKKPPRFFFSITKKVWEKRWSPFGIVRKSGRCMQSIIFSRFVKKRIGGDIPQNELNDYKIFLKKTLLLPGSTEYALFSCFDNYLHAKLPLDDEATLRSIQIPVSFLYGDRDWMLNVGTHDALAQNPYKGTHSHRYTVENSDHHMYFDNPEHFVDIILQDLSNLDDLQPPTPIETSDVNIITIAQS